MVVPALLSVVLLLQPPVEGSVDSPAEPAPQQEPAPEPCPRNTTSCATGCVPLGQSCPSAAELDPSSVPKQDAASAAARAEVRELVSDRRSPRRQARGPCLEPSAEWQIRRMRVGFGLAIPGAAMLAPVLYSALSIPQYSKIEGRTRGVAATFGLLGAGLILAAIIAPQLMRRREVSCSSETCSLTLRF